MIDILNNKIELIKMFIDNTPIAYVVLDREYRIHYINKSFVKLRKLDMNTTIGNKCYNLSNGGVRCANCAVAQTLSSGKAAFVTRKDILQEGTVRFIDDYAIPLQYDENNQVEFVLEIMIDRSKEMMAREQRNKDYDEILSMLSVLLESKDRYTANHSDNVRKLSLNLAFALGMSQEEAFEISVAASLHDMGKVTIADSIINKNGKLTDEEFFQMKNHPVASFDILEGLSSFKKMGHIARHHHERVDGNGYPDGLTGDEISIGAKIVAIADTYDAMTTTRSYRKSLSHDYAVQEITRVAGKQLDADIAKVFVEMDFENMVDGVYEKKKPRKNHFERVITQIDNSPPKEDEMKNLSQLDMNNLLMEIFKSTPCGYLLLDKNQNIQFISDYLMDYFDIADNDTIGMNWQEFLGLDNISITTSAISACVHSGKTEHLRQECVINSRSMIFDVYGVPIYDGDNNLECIIGITIDRTKEIELKRSREKDFDRLIDKLNTILLAKKEETDEINLSQSIAQLQERINQLKS